jgi:hypothetical protein
MSSFLIKKEKQSNDKDEVEILTQIIEKQNLTSIPFQKETIFNQKTSLHTNTTYSTTSVQHLYKKVEVLESENKILQEKFQTKSNETDLLKQNKTKLSNKLNDLKLKLKEHESLKDKPRNEKNEIQSINFSNNFYFYYNSNNC